MTLLDAVILGLVQGLTEFLPVSSSGHLVLMEYWMGVASPGVTFEIAVHLGTLFSILIMLRSDIQACWRSILHLLGFRRSAESSSRLSGLVLLGILPAGIAGMLFRSFFERFFDSPAAVGGFLMLTGAVLIATRFRRPAEGDLTVPRVWIVGLVQILAILPGISRSGSTIAAGLLSGIRAETAVTFSFLMAVPLLVGASFLEGLHLWSAPPSPESFPPLLLGMAVACLSGCGAITWLLRALKSGWFSSFGYYCCTIGVITILALT